MNAHRSLTALLVLVLAGCGNNGSRAPDTEADIAAIRKYDEQWLKALEAGDAQALRELSDENHVTFPSNMPPLEGRDANYAANSKWLAQTRVVEHWEPREIVVAADWAYESGHFTAQMTPRSGGDVTHFSGNYLRILRRQADGSWKMIREMATSDQPAPPAQ